MWCHTVARLFSQEVQQNGRVHGAAVWKDEKNRRTKERSGIRHRDRKTEAPPSAAGRHTAASYGLHLEWEVIHQAGQSGAVDMFLNFPVMDMNRNAIWRNPDNASRIGMARMTRFWGNESWREAAYAKSKQIGLFGTKVEKQPNEKLGRGSLKD
jgi:hypothetical protein